MHTYHPTFSTSPPPPYRARQELHDLESSVDGAGVLPRAEVPHRSEPPELEDVEEETEVRDTHSSWVVMVLLTSTFQIDGLYYTSQIKY